MTDHTSVSIPAPKDWQPFERNARLLFQYSLNDPAVQNNGTSGQRQHGVDIFGRRGSGTGPLVGIQCKGKSADYGGKVTEKELRDEVEKTKKFVPPLDEFILITTAPNDAKIQAAARILEAEVRAQGRSLTIQVWGWERVQQEIVRFPETIRVFHPDATPFSDQILNEERETRRLVAETSNATLAEIAGISQQLAHLTARLPTIAGETSTASDALDKELSSQIDGYRDLLRNNKPRTALELLAKLKDRVGDSASRRIRYRILSNIGAAHFNLGEHDIAADYLLEAAPLNPDDPVSLANKTAALLIKGRKAEAHALALQATAAHPDSQEIAQQRLQALGEGETAETVWQTLSDAAKRNPVAFGIRITALRGSGDPSWRTVTKEALAAYPDNTALKIIKAEGIIDALLKGDAGAIGLDTGDVPTQEDISEAAETLEKAWRDSVDHETPVKAACAHNAALAWSLLGETQRAGDLLDAAMASGFNTNKTKHNRIMLYRRNDQIAEAIRVADTLEDAPISRIIRADLRIETDPTSARDILSGRAEFTQETDIIAAALAITETYLKEGNFSTAEVEAERLQNALRDHPQGYLALFRVKSQRGDENAGTALDRALALVTDYTDFPTRFLVAEALASVQRYDDVAELLAGRTSTNFDSPALRALVAAAINSDRRVLARKLLKDLPELIAQRPFYQKASVALEMRAGNIRAAEHAIRNFLAHDPANLELHLQLLLALYRQDKIEELRKEATKPFAQFKGVPEDFMKLAQFKDDFGDWHEAHALGYKTLLENPTNQTVSTGYLGVFFRSGHSREMPVSPPVVEVDTAVALIQDDGAKPVYIIEPDANLRPSAQFIAPDHRVAKLLLGKKVGDEIELPDKTHAKITTIKTKQLHALHDVMENFNNRYPEARGLERVKVDPENEGGLEPMLEKVRDRHDAIEQVNKLYAAGTMPLALAALAVGCDPVEALVGIASSGVAIRSCEGSHLERMTASAAIEANAGKGCIVDFATLYIIRRLNLEKAVVAVCGPMGIVESTGLYFQERVHELSQRLDESDMSIAYRDGQYFRLETTPQQKKDALAVAEEDRKWMMDNTTIIPAEGKQDPGASWRPLIEQFGSSFLDDLRAAQGSGRLLVCEDQLLRQLALLDFRVLGTWLQPILMRALSMKVITETEYRDAIVGLIDSGLEFVSVSTDLLVSTVSKVTGHSLTPAFEKLASRLGGKKADLPSHVSVALNAAVRIWNNPSLSHTFKDAVLGRLLERLITDRTMDEIKQIIGAFVERSGGSFTTYIVNWLRGHFLILA